MAIKVLDCTLRDGGYVNNWDFGEKNIISMISLLGEAGIDIIECGFLSERDTYTRNQSKFNTLDEIEGYIQWPNLMSTYVCMINYGEYRLAQIPDYSGGNVKGIRVVFHRNEMEDALEYCNQLVHKGYLVFVQPMVTINYTDYELLDMVERINRICPFACYIVDSFGVMKQRDLTRIFYLLDNNLDVSIHLGYHSHNNMQLAYSNAQMLVNKSVAREIIIDSSVFGMGRGAGNLNTELFVNYLNENNGGHYKVTPLLQMIDDVLNKIYAENYWGYSLAHYLSAMVNCHPNYATYLTEKNVLNISAIDKILKSISPLKKDSFDKQYIEELYLSYQQKFIDDTAVVKQLANRWIGKTILVLAPGKTLFSYKDVICQYIEKHKPVVIAVNFWPQNFPCDDVFISNARRYREFCSLRNPSKEEAHVIVTSNIVREASNFEVVNYGSLLNDESTVEDNATLMLIKLLEKCGICTIQFGGFDGYSLDFGGDYVEKTMAVPTSKKNAELMNQSIRKFLHNMSDHMHFSFITPSRYVENSQEL